MAVTQDDPISSTPPPIIEDDSGEPRPIGVPRDYAVPRVDYSGERNARFGRGTSNP